MNKTNQASDEAPMPAPHSLEGDAPIPVDYQHYAPLAMSICAKKSRTEDSGPTPVEATNSNPNSNPMKETNPASNEVYLPATPPFEGDILLCLALKKSDGTVAAVPSVEGHPFAQNKAVSEQETTKLTKAVTQKIRDGWRDFDSMSCLSEQINVKWRAAFRLGPVVWVRMLPFICCCFSALRVVRYSAIRKNRGGVGVVCCRMYHGSLD